MNLVLFVYGTWAIAARGADSGKKHLLSVSGTGSG
jgi:hypothetical protein